MSKGPLCILLVAIAATIPCGHALRQFVPGIDTAPGRAVELDVVNEDEAKIMVEIAETADYPLLANGPAQPLDEILAYWYTSHRALLSRKPMC